MKNLNNYAILRGGKYKKERVLGQGDIGRVLIVSLLILFSVQVMAQASGGQIRRTNKISSPSGNKDKKNNNPKIKVISESEKTCELYYDADKKESCIPQNQKGKYVIPSRVKGYTVVKVGDWAFYDCEISEVEIPNTVICIGKNAFRLCTKLSNIIIPESVRSIEIEAFFYCVSLTSITLPCNINTIEPRAFTHCEKLTQVISEITNPFILGNGAFSKNLTLIVPFGTRQRYIQSFWDSYFSTIIEK